MTRLEPQLTEFIERLRGRLRAGEAVYGSASFERPIAELIDEVMQEALDISGWAFLAWLRLRELRRAVAHIEEHQGGTNG